MSTAPDKPTVTIVEQDPAIDDLDRETAAIAQIERLLRELDATLERTGNTRTPSKRVLAYLAERHRIIGSPGRKSAAQGGK